MDTAHYTTEEIWRPIPGWEGYYEVSDYGQVRSIPRDVPFMAHGHPQMFRRKSVILKGSLTGRRLRYRTVNLWKDNRQYPYKVHHLILLTFIGPRPTGTEANHRDGNSFNNKATNLEWITPAQNKQHASAIGRANGNRYRRRSG